MNDNSGKVIVITPVKAEDFPADVGIDVDDIIVGEGMEVVGVEAEILDLPAEGTLAFLQEKVGGMIDVIGGEDGTDYWLHDEGRLIDLPVNPIVSDIIGTVVCGPVVIAAHDDEGNTIGLPTSVIRAARRFFAHQQVEQLLAVGEMREAAERVVEMAEEMLRGE